MSDEPVAPTPSGDPDPDPAREPPGPPPTRLAVALERVMLTAVVFVATLLLLLGATRLIERGGVSARPSSSDGAVAVPSTSAAPTASPSAASPSATASPGGGSVGPSGSMPPTASPSLIGDPVLVGAGDIGHCSSDGDAATADLLDGIAGTVFTAGDNAYESGSAAQFRDCYEPDWGRHRARTRPAPGNHDWETKDLAGYLDYFGDSARGPDGTSWYSYDLGTWHVIVLDSMCDKVGGCDPASPQGRWLAADLAASDATCTLAIFHHPRFSSGEHGATVGMDAFWRPLYAAGVDVIVNGHDHDYERFARQDPDGRADTERGIRQFVVGTGGAPLRSFPRVAPNSEVRLQGGHGVLKFTLRDGSYDTEFITAGNDFRDRGTERCH